MRDKGQSSLVPSWHDMVSHSVSPPGLREGWNSRQFLENLLLWRLKLATRHTMQKDYSKRRESSPKFGPTLIPTQMTTAWKRPNWRVHIKFVWTISLMILHLSPLHEQWWSYCIWLKPYPWSWSTLLRHQSTPPNCFILSLWLFQSRESYIMFRTRAAASETVV